MWDLICESKMELGYNFFSFFDRLTYHRKRRRDRKRNILMDGLTLDCVENVSSQQ